MLDQIYVDLVNNALIEDNSKPTIEQFTLWNQIELSQLLWKEFNMSYFENINKAKDSNALYAICNHLVWNKSLNSNMYTISFDEVNLHWKLISQIEKEIEEGMATWESESSWSNVAQWDIELKSRLLEAQMDFEILNIRSLAFSVIQTLEQSELKSEDVIYLNNFRKYLKSITPTLINYYTEKDNQIAKATKLLSKIFINKIDNKITNK